MTASRIEPEARKLCQSVIHVSVDRTHDAVGRSVGNFPVAHWVALLGVSASSRNQGVQALGASLVSLFIRDSAGVGIRWFIGQSHPLLVSYRVRGNTYYVPVTNYRLSPNSSLREHLLWIVLMCALYRLIPIRGMREMIARGTPWIAAMNTCAFAADIRGGDSFSDIYGIKRFLIGFLAAWTAVLVKGTIIQLPQTYGPFKSHLARCLARYLLLRSSVIVARDRASMRVAKDLVGPDREVMLSPDIAFALEAWPPDSVVLDPPLLNLALPGIIGVNISGLMYHGGYNCDNMFGLRMNYSKFVSDLLVALLNEQPHEVWLVPHTYAPDGDVESDPEVSYQARELLPAELQQRVRIVAAEYDPHQIKSVIGMCDFFIGSRMHACIAALSQGIPCVGVAYSMKFKGVFESVGMEEWVVDGRDLGEEEAVSRIIALYRSRLGIRKTLCQNAVKARNRLDRVFQEMLELSRHG